MRVSSREWPSDWNQELLGNLCEIDIGKTPIRNNQSYWNGSHTWLSIADMTDRVVCTSKEHITDLAIADGQARLVKEGTLLMSFKLTIGKLAFAGKDLYTNEAIAALTINDEFQEKLLPDFLYWALQAVPLETDATLAVKGKTLNKKSMKLIPVPLPHIAEQRRIVARIEALLAEVREMRKLQGGLAEDTKQFMNACIQEVFSPQNSHWHTDKLSDLAFIQTGVAKGGRYGNSQLVELPYLRVANVQAGYLDLDEIKSITIPKDRLERYRLKVGDLLLTEGGDYDKLGRGAIWEGQIDSVRPQKSVYG